MIEKLKPCPFCGTKVEVRKEAMWHGSHGYKDCYRYDVRCQECGCRISMRNTDTINRTDRKAKQNAIEAWNRRA